MRHDTAERRNVLRELDSQPAVRVAQRAQPLGAPRVRRRARREVIALLLLLLCCRRVVGLGRGGRAAASEQRRRWVGKREPLIVSPDQRRDASGAAHPLRWLCLRKKQARGGSAAGDHQGRRPHLR